MKKKKHARSVNWKFKNKLPFLSSFVMYYNDYAFTTLIKRAFFVVIENGRIIFGWADELKAFVCKQNLNFRTTNFTADLTKST